MRCAIVAWVAALALCCASLGRCDLTDGAEGFNGLPYARRRDLLQAGESDAEKIKKCVWNSKGEACVMNPVVALRFLDRAPDSKLKELVFELVDCRFRGTAELCGDEKKCLWDPKHETCTFRVGLAQQERFEQCLGDAAVFLESDKRMEFCFETYQTEDSCNISKDCSWREEGACLFDMWKYLTGVASDGELPRGLEGLMELRGSEMGDDLETVDIKTPKDILDWTPPPFTCPDGVDQVLCHVGEETDQLLLTDLYCNTKLLLDGSCEDDLCQETVNSTQGNCTAAAAVSEQIYAAQTGAYLKAINNPTASKIVSQEVDCLKLTNTTCKGDCEFDKDLEECGVSSKFLFGTLAAHPVTEADDPSCQLVQSMLNSGCMARVSEEECIGDQDGKCIWDTNGICTPGPLTLVNVLFADDKKLQAEAKKASDSCRSIDTKSKCK